jgi:hypothetical protein
LLAEHDGVAVGSAAGGGGDGDGIGRDIAFLDDADPAGLVGRRRQVGFDRSGVAADQLQRRHGEVGRDLVAGGRIDEAGGEVEALDASGR